MIIVDILAAYLVVLGLSLVLTRSNFVLEAPLVIPRLLGRLFTAIKERRADRDRADIEVESQASTWTAGDDQ
jgi:hypothetical protein